MKDSSEQSGEHAAYESLSAILRERLLRRLIEPAGVIDVRYAQQKYERFAEWLGKRLALLHQLQNRYADNSTDDSQPLLLQRPIEEAINFYSATVQSTAEQSVIPAVRGQSFARPEIAEPFSPSPVTQLSSEEIATTAHTTARPLTHSSLPLPEGEFRVSRRRAPFNPGPVQETSALAGLPPADRPARSKQAIAEPSVSEPDDVRGAKKNHEQSGGGDSGSANRQAVANEIVQNALDDSSRGTSLPLAKLPAAPNLSERRGRVTPTGDQPNASDAVKPPEPNASADSSSANRQAIAGEVAPRATTNAASKASLPLAKPQAGALPKEYQVASPLIERREERATERESVVAPEITEGLFTQTKSEIVWRKGPGVSPEANSISSGQAGNLTGETPQVDSPSNALHSQSTVRRSPPGQGVQSQGGEIGIEQIGPQVIRAISEKVMRVISRDLAIELERRGFKKWR
jgi:hypothetical protein